MAWHGTAQHSTAMPAPGLDRARGAGRGGAAAAAAAAEPGGRTSSELHRVRAARHQQHGRVQRLRRRVPPQLPHERAGPPLQGRLLAVRRVRAGLAARRRRLTGMRVSTVERGTVAAGTEISEKLRMYLEVVASGPRRGCSSLSCPINLKKCHGKVFFRFQVSLRRHALMHHCPSRHEHVRSGRRGTKASRRASTQSTSAHHFKGVQVLSCPRCAALGRDGVCWDVCGGGGGCGRCGREWRLEGTRGRCGEVWNGVQR